MTKPTNNYGDPEPRLLRHPVFNAIWDEIKSWDIYVPEEYEGYCAATGNHAAAIFRAIDKIAMPDETGRLKADNAALREVLGEMAGKFGGIVQVGSLYHQAQTLLATEHPGDNLLRELDEAKQNRAALLRDRIDLLHERAELLAEVERLRGLNGYGLKRIERHHYRG